MAFILDAACLCHTGRIRKNNEDNFFFHAQILKAENDGMECPAVMWEKLHRDCCLAVFDGMGGENFGELASYAAAEYMQKSVRKGRGWFVPVRKYLQTLCTGTNEAVVGKAEELCTDRMGSTLAALYVSNKRVYACNLGDSRAYRLRGEVLRQLSKDHVGKREGCQKAPLIQYLGIDPEYCRIEAFIAEDKLKKGDQYLLCSDGLTDMLTDPEITDILKKKQSVQETVRELTDKALENGGKDNVTAIVCRII